MAAKEGLPAGVSSVQRIRALAAKEFSQLKRDRVLMVFIFVFPVALLTIFGFALNTTVKGIDLAVLDRAQDRVSERFTERFEAEDRFNVFAVRTQQEGLEDLRNAQARALLVIPEGAMDAVRSGEPLAYTLYVDGSDPTVSVQIRAAAAAATQEMSVTLAAARSLRSSISARPPVSPEVQVLYNPDDRSAVYIVPGLIGLILTIVACLLTAIVIVRERELGTMEGLIATPVKPYEVILGKIAPYFFLGILDAVIVVVVGVLLFKVPFVGSPFLLAAAMLLFLLGSLGVGIVISTFAQTQIQSVFWIIGYFFPSIFLSGMIFPVEGMAGPFRVASQVVPLRHFLKIARGVMLRGADALHLVTPFVALGIFCVVMLVLASVRFRKTL